MSTPELELNIPELEQLAANANPASALEMRKYHKVERPYLGLRNPDIDALVTEWRGALDVPARVVLADALWQSNIHEARVAAAKLLTQARLRPDDEAAWQLIASWTPDFDSWAIADHACIAAQKRLVADPSRLDTLEGWISSDHLWTRRAALVATLPWTKMAHPKAADLAIRDRILGWCATLAPDHRWFIQKAIGWWLRDLSKHDPERTLAFLEAQGDTLKPFAAKEATRLMKAS
ncbi:3-methyladenine DNA glycosylase AlkD [Sulfitobacter brevis]|uniref:3-methyladenine DNA glycosylase AlkD n=1 Tax=Sulfitobacter brevis TaxID=74348 RepID=A0A1I2C9V1_9RHOB|nr:DNA alkylation repair protein [Sulfitobacter brevis]SFE65096.1 3-methyladenine DNA glycosylase AlkD [Sulfitobacter brevis]